MPVSSRTFSVRSRKLLQDEKLGSVILRLMMAVNDITIASKSLYEWQHTDDAEKKARWRGGVLYFGRLQSAHLFEALSIIKEIRDDADLMAVVQRVDIDTQQSFQTVAKFIGSSDYVMMAKLRNIVAFHYEPKLSVRRLKKIADDMPGHLTTYSLGNKTLDWYFELGDLVVDEIVVREVFQISVSANLEQAALQVLNRLRVIALAFMDFSGYFVRGCFAKK
jgi:hypothetical protein